MSVERQERLSAKRSAFVRDHTISEVAARFEHVQRFFGSKAIYNYSFALYQEGDRGGDIVTTGRVATLEDPR